MLPYSGKHHRVVRIMTDVSEELTTSIFMVEGGRARNQRAEGRFKHGLDGAISKKMVTFESPLCTEYPDLPSWRRRPKDQHQHQHQMPRQSDAPLFHTTTFIQISLNVILSIPYTPHSSVCITAPFTLRSSEYFLEQSVSTASVV
jgi:hypothetical protein